MAGLSTGKIAEVMFGEFCETYEHQSLMLDLVDGDSADSATQQNAGNTFWYPVQQHRPILNGFDLTGQEQGIIEETYPISLGDPHGDLVEQRIDDMRDIRFWERAGRQGGYQQATELNGALARLIANTGSLFFRTADTNGFDFISNGQVLINERQVERSSGANFILNDRDLRNYASELSGRETVKGRPETAWNTGQIGSQVAEFDLYSGSFLPNLTGGASPDTTVSADVSEKPEPGTVDNVTNTVTNVDYRRGSISVVDSSGYAVGDFISFAGVESVGLASKDETGQDMTFKIVAIPDGTTIEVFPKPIALDDPALTTLEQAYANINTQITTGDVVARLNIDASDKTNLFWTKDSIQMIGGDVPWELMSQYEGSKVLKKSLTSGINLYMIYGGNAKAATFYYRLFVWYGLANRNPMANGTGLSTV